MKIRFGNVTVDTDSLSDIQQAAQDAGGAVTGGHFGGQNHGITGGVFHGAVHIDRDDD